MVENKEKTIESDGEKVSLGAKAGNEAVSGGKTKKYKLRFLCRRNHELYVTFFLTGLCALCLFVAYFFASYPGWYEEIELWFLASVVVAGYIFLAMIMYYFPRAVMLGRLMRGRRMLAHWTLEDDEIEDIAVEARREGLFSNIAFAVLCSGIFAHYTYMFISNGCRGSFYGIMMAFAAVAMAAAYVYLFVSPSLQYHRTMRNAKEVIIGERSLYYCGWFFYRFRVNPHLTTCKYNRETNTIVMIYSRVRRNGTCYKKMISVSVPENEAETVEMLEAHCAETVDNYRREQEKRRAFTETDDED